MCVLDAAQVAAATLGRHGDSSHVQKCGLLSLGRLAGGMAEGRKLIDVRAAALAVAAMRAYPTNPDLIQYGCFLLGSITFSVKDVSFVADAGGLWVVLDALRMHIANPQVQVPQCQGLFKTGLEHRLCCCTRG